MAQHDYVIDNSTGANVRADINSALQAIVTNNSGSSTPSTTYALQTFANTTDSMLQLRNSANNAFVNLRKFDGTLPLPDGSASSPSLFFDDDTDTGIFSDAANHFQIATAGVERVEFQTTEVVFNDGGNDIDFRIEGDTDANLFKVDAGNNRIGIGTASPTGVLEIDSSSTSDQLMFDVSGTNYARIGHNTSGGQALLDIRSEGHARILTNGNNTAIFIKNNQNVGIGTTSPTSKLDCAGNISLTASDPKIFFNTGGSMISNANVANTLAFFSDGSTERARIDSSGDIMMGRTTVLNNAKLSLEKAHTVLAIRQSANANHKAIDITHLFATTGSTNATAIGFRDANGNLRGSITNNTSTTSYNTSSDYRLKENEVLISDGITRLKTLKPYRFNWKNVTDKKVDGFFAHEVTQAVPEAVIGEKDAPIGEDGQGYQQIDQSKLVPLLVAAVQELIGKVEALEAA